MLSPLSGPRFPPRAIQAYSTPLFDVKIIPQYCSGLRSQRNALSATLLRLRFLADLTLEKIVQSSPQSGNSHQLFDVFPRWGDGGPQDEGLAYRNWVASRLNGL